MMRAIGTHAASFIIFALGLSAAVPAVAAELVNINIADVETLQQLKGIGPAKAEAIIDYRQAHGPFTRIKQIQNVWGIGPSTYEDIKDFITVGSAYHMEPEVVTPPAPQTAVAPPETTIVREEPAATSTSEEAAEGSVPRSGPLSAAEEKNTDDGLPFEKLPTLGAAIVICLGILALYANRLV